jgi:hypothetical protein
MMNHPIIRPIPFLNLPPNRLILFHINPRSRQPRRQLIPADNDRRVRLEEPIDVFERAVGGFGVEEVGYWDEGEADAGLVVWSVYAGDFDGSIVRVRKGVRCVKRRTQMIQNL